MELSSSPQAAQPLLSCPRELLLSSLNLSSNSSNLQHPVPQHCPGKVAQLTVPPFLIIISLSVHPATRRMNHLNSSAVAEEL